jgi:glutathione S-transferase
MPKKDRGEDPLTTIRVTLQYPRNQLRIHSAQFFPMCLKAHLIGQRLAQAHRDLDCELVEIAPFGGGKYKHLTGNQLPPFIELVRKGSRDSEWSTDPKKLDSLLASSAQEENSHQAIWEDWIDSAFELPYLTLLFLNEDNMKRVSRIWLPKHEETIAKRFAFYAFCKKWQWRLRQASTDPRRAYRMAYERLDEELLTALEDHFEQGHQYLSGDSEPSAADCSLYAYLKCLSLLYESGMVNRRALLRSYMQRLETCVRPVEDHSEEDSPTSLGERRFYVPTASLDKNTAVGGQ